jgi:hypothetical protein
MIINRAMISEIDEEKDALIGNYIIINTNYYYQYYHLDYSNIRADPIKQITH